MGQATPEEAILTTRLDGLRLLPRGRLDATDVSSFEEELARPGALKEALESTEGSSDIVLMDTPSGLGRVTTAALCAADFALLVFQTESLALRSLGQSLRLLEHISRRPTRGSGSSASCPTSSSGSDTAPMPC